MSEDAEHPDVVDVDARGLICPLPVLKAIKCLRRLPSGSLVQVRATDPRAPAELSLFCREHGHTLVGSRNTPRDGHHDGEGVFSVLIRKS